MTALALAMALGAAAAGAAEKRAAPIVVDLWHVNDVHGWIMPRPAGFRSPTPQRLVGGYAALVNVVRKDPVPHLFLDAGDWFQGTPEGTKSRGQAAVDCMNAAGLDAAEMGNHDLDFGVDRLRALAGSLKMPVLGANVYEQASGKRPAFLTPHLVKEVAGVKVGLFGLLTANVPNLTFPKNFAGLRFRSEVDEARDQVAELKALGATVVVAVTHVGFRDATMPAFDDDKVLAARVPGIDVIVGGHTHTFLRQPYRDAVHGTLVVQDGVYLTTAGKVTLEIDARTKKVLRSTGTLVDLWLDETGEDAALKAVVDRDVDHSLDVVVGTAAADLARNKTSESPLGDWVTDCEREKAGSEIAFMNFTGLRADLPAGPVTLRRLFEVSPFDNFITTFTMTGVQVLETLEHGTGDAPGLVQVSGLTFTYHPEADAGHRVAKVWVGGRPLDAGGRYAAATVDFLAGGGDGYAHFGDPSGRTNTRALLRDALADCARAQSPFGAPAPGRVAAVQAGP